MRLFDQQAVGFEELAPRRDVCFFGVLGHVPTVLWNAIYV